MHKAPANELVRGALNVTQRLTFQEQGVLNPAGVNCIRYFPREGIRVWGGRTLADAASEWRYLSVRRLFNTYGYTDNAAHTFGTHTKETKTGIYHYNATAVTFDSDKSGAVNTQAAGEMTGDNDILNSISGDSKGIAIKAASGSGKLTFVRGVAGQVKQFYEQITDFVGGFVTDTAKGIQKRIDDQASRIEKLEKHVAKYKSRLTLQFAQLEMSMSKLQNQSSSFQAQIGSIRR